MTTIAAGTTTDDAIGSTTDMTIVGATRTIDRATKTTATAAIGMRSRR